MTRVSEQLLFLPLGGAGEIGMNLNLYGFGGRWLMVDLGIAFGDERTPGVDVMVPDTAFIEAERDNLDGLVITHAHEDHLGAVQYLWPRLRCPVFATPFTCALLRGKLAETDFADEIPLHEIPAGGQVSVGRFRVEYIRATHSIPEAHVLAIRTPLGTIAHATDWKLDPKPLVGPVTDDAALRKLGDEGVLAMVGDSTNVFVDGEVGSESALRDSLTRLIGACEGRVAIACFASNVARIDTIAAAAEANGRHAALVGRSLWRTTEAARATGYLQDTPPFLTEHDIGYLPPDKLVLAVTGSQGEPRSALSRIAAGDHANVTLAAGDTVVFSSREIPGNERAIGRVQNLLVRQGVRVVTEADHFVHVSGHPARDELSRMYGWLRPQMLVPIHGETRHLREHAAFAERCQIAQTAVAENGDMLQLAPGPPRVVERVPAGRLAVDGNRLLPLDGSVLRARRRIGFAGAAVATVVLDGRGRLQADPQLTVQGLLDGDDDDASRQSVIAAIADAVAKLSAAQRRDDDAVSEAARIAVRRTLRDVVGKRPATHVHVVRV